MVCVCSETITGLRQALQRLPSPDPDPGAEPDPNTAAADDVRALHAQMAALGLPAPVWQPEEEWLDLQLPTLPLHAGAMATVSAFAQLRADAMLQAGIDLLVPGQANALIRLVATLNARMEAVLAAEPLLAQDVNPQGWQDLSSTMTAVDQVTNAAPDDLLPDLPPDAPQDPPLPPWRPFLRQLRPLLPLLAASVQLNVDLAADISAQLAAAIRAMIRIQLPQPTVETITLMATLTSSLSAVGQLRQALGVDPLEAGVQEVRQMVAQRVRAAARQVRETTGRTVSDLVTAQPVRDYRPTLIASPAAVQLAMSIDARALQSITWQVPAVASLPVLSIGLPAVAFTAQMRAALGIAVATAPCGARCDGAALLRTSLAVSGSAAAGVRACLVQTETYPEFLR